MADELKQLEEKLHKIGIRVVLDDRNEKVGYKIREAQLQKIPYMLLMGDKDIEGNCVSVRKRGEGDIGAMGVDEFVEMAAKQIESKEIF